MFSGMMWLRFVYVMVSVAAKTKTGPHRHPRQSEECPQPHRNLDAGRTRVCGFSAEKNCRTHLYEAIRCNFPKSRKKRHSVEEWSTPRNTESWLLKRKVTRQASQKPLSVGSWRLLKLHCPLVFLEMLSSMVAPLFNNWESRQIGVLWREITFWLIKPGATRAAQGW